MAKTEKGREIRDHFIKCRRELMRLKSQPQFHQVPTATNADPFIEMIETDLTNLGVATPFIKGWKYTSLKVLHPEYSAIFDEAQKLILGSCAEVESPVNVTTISQIIDKKYNLKIPAEYLNKIWVEMGFQYRTTTSKCKWILTDKGKKYGRLVPYPTGNQGYQLLWFTSVADVTFEYLKTRKQQGNAS